MVDHQSVSWGEREGGESEILVGQDNNTNRGEEGGGGGVERERWYLVYNCNSIWDQSISQKGWK